MDYSDLRKYNNQVAIVLVGYNRIKGIQRLLSSLEKADYPSTDIPLVISIDCSGNEELYNYVNQYKWQFGPKFVNIESKRLGLKKHILKCGDLTSYFKAIILLEDDLFVSPQFYNYTIAALANYGEDERIAQISLYRNEVNGYVGLPFEEEKSGADIFLMQATSSWGECWNSRMWKEFRNNLEDITEETIENCDIPECIKGWKRAWSKFFTAFIINSDKYVLYPTVSHTTNFNDAGGEHFSSGITSVQVSLQYGPVNYRMPSINLLSCYDIYCNNKKVYRWIGIEEKDLCLDLYGFNNNFRNKKYVLSSRLLPYKILKSFGLQMRPIEFNILYNISGEGLYLYDTSVREARKITYDQNVSDYFLKGFNVRLLFHEIMLIYKEKIKRRLHI